MATRAVSHRQDLWALCRKQKLSGLPYPVGRRSLSRGVRLAVVTTGGRRARADRPRQDAAASWATSAPRWTPPSRFAPRCCGTGSPMSRPGGGFVAHSDPAAEGQETRSKVAAVLVTIETLQRQR